MEATMPPTHAVFNQPPPLTGYDLADDPAMLQGQARQPVQRVREVDQAAGADRRLDAAIARLRAELSHSARAEVGARRLAEHLAVVLQGSLLARYGDPAVADAFAVSRLGGDWGGAFGTLPAGAGTGTIIKRVTPVLQSS
jgi:putative acyl-CoA dehydrogenase